MARAAAISVDEPDARAQGIAPDERALWQRFRQDRDAAARESLLAKHLPYARTVAATYYGRRLHNEIEFDDYLQYARVGLLEALDRFDPERGAQFRTFAARRMHGAILDGLERFTEKQQQISVQQRLRKERIDAIKRAATPESERSVVKSHGEGAGGNELFRYLAEVGIGIALCSLLEGTGMVDAGDALPQAAGGVPYDTLELSQLRQRLVAAVDRLHPQQRTVIRYHYLQEHPFEQIAVMLSLTRGRISQIHRAALLALRDELAATLRCDVCW